VYRLKKSLSAGSRLPWGFKIGHGGTLDPFATGLMVVFYGEATKLSNAYLRSKKSYSGRMSLGTQTDTADYTGRPVAEAAVPKLSLGGWQALANTFVAESYLQTPPMYSAKRVEGVHLYHIAREGREVERTAILKKIFEFTLSQPAAPDLDFTIACESGTYVRTIAEDLAQKAGTHAHLKSLRRTVSSDFTIQKAVPLAEAVERLSSPTPARALEFGLPIHEIATHLPSINIAPADEESLRRGHTITARALLDRFQTGAPEAHYGLLRALDSFPVGLVYEFKLQRILNRGLPL
jgi:tRNA pseudouridine55 synthase